MVVTAKENITSGAQGVPGCRGMLAAFCRVAGAGPTADHGATADGLLKQVREQSNRCRMLQAGGRVHAKARTWECARQVSNTEQTQEAGEQGRDLKERRCAHCGEEREHEWTRTLAQQREGPTSGSGHKPTTEPICVFLQLPSAARLPLAGHVTGTTLHFTLLGMLLFVRNHIKGIRERKVWGGGGSNYKYGPERSK